MQKIYMTYLALFLNANQSVMRHVRQQQKDLSHYHCFRSTLGAGSVWSIKGGWKGQDWL